ncbi:MAG TPA: M48 family metalloprotease, partial [Terriglobales bacterium]|nr:M48 family metalloprotease [Terriglobales bacterium]
MRFAENNPTMTADTPEARRYNRIHRWLEVSDFVLGLAFLLGLLLTGWNSVLRDWAYQAAFQNYTFSVFLYVFMLMLAAKVLGLGLDYYGLRLERRFQLTNQKTRAWIWDETKGFLVGLVLAGFVAELLYFTMRESPQHWWLMAWALFMVLFIVLAQVAPLILFPIFYKFEPLDNDDLKQRLVHLSERAGTRVRGIYKWNLSEKSKKANAALTGLGATRRIILADTLLDQYSADEIEAVLAHELGHHVHKHILKSIVVQAGITLFGFWAANYVLHLAIERWGMFDTL